MVCACRVRTVCTECMAVMNGTHGMNLTRTEQQPSRQLTNDHSMKKGKPKYKVTQYRMGFS